MIEDYLRLEVINSSFLVKVDPCVKIFFVISHHDVQVLLPFFIGNITSQYLYDKIIFEHLDYLYLAIFVSGVLYYSFYCNDLSCFSISASEDLSKSALTDELDYLDIVITEIG